jgi:hypothetical protein
MSKMPLLAAFALASALAACGTEPPRMVQLSTTLNGAQEVPPTPSGASGQGTATFDRQTRQLSWSVSYTGLSGPLQSAHFHGPASSGSNAAVQVAMPVQHSPLVGSAVLSDSQANDLLAGRMYVNLHTPIYPNGEIRGQMQAITP